MKYLGYYKTPPKEGGNVVHLTVHSDFDLTLFIFAWRACCEKTGKIIWPNQLVLHNESLSIGNIYLIDMIRAFETLFEISVIMTQEGDPNEWWITFQESDIVFYSAGA